MKKFLNEATENLICEDILSKFDFFDEEIIRDYIIESYGFLNEVSMGNIISKVRSGIGQVAGKMRDWAIQKIKEIKDKFNATKVVPFIETQGGKKVYRFFVRRNRNQCLFSTASGDGIVGYYFDPSKNAGTIVFRDLNKLNRLLISKSKSKVFESNSFLSKLSVILESDDDDEDEDILNLSSDNDSENFKSSIGSDFEIKVDDDVSKTVGSYTADAFDDLVGIVKRDSAKKYSDTPIPGTPQYVENINVVSIRELKKLVASLLAQAIINNDSSDPPRMYIAGPPGTGKTQIVESFAGTPVTYLDLDTGKTVDTGEKWQLHILEVDKLFPEIFAGFPVEVMIPILKKDPSKRTSEEQSKVDQLSAELNVKRKRINSSVKDADANDYNTEVEYRKRIKLLQTDLFPSPGDDGYHIFFFDELNRGSPEKIGAVMNLLYQGKIGSSYRIPKHSIMIAAGNVGDRVIDFEKVKQLFGTFYSRMEDIYVTNYDWSERIRFGREYQGSKPYSLSVSDKEGRSLNIKVSVDMGNRDPLIVTTWIQNMINKYGNSFTYKLYQLNKNDPAYTLDYRIISNISKKMKILALQDWYSDRVEEVDANGYDKEHYKQAFERLRQELKTPQIVRQKYGRDIEEFKTIKWSSPEQLFMTANSRYYFIKAFRGSFSNSPRAETLLRAALKAWEESISSAIRISKNDVKYTLAIHCLDEKFLSMAESGEGGNAIQHFVNELRSIIISTKTGKKFWEEVKSCEPEIESKIKDLFSEKSKNSEVNALKLLKNIINREDENEKGYIMFAANVEVLFERMKTGGTGKQGTIRKDYMKEVADEIERAIQDAASLPNEEDRQHIEEFVNTVLNLVSKVNKEFAVTRLSNYNYRTIGEIVPDSTGTPVSFMIMGYFLRKNKNAFLKLSWAREIAMKVKNKYLDGSINPPAVIRVEDFLTPDVMKSNYEDYLMNGKNLNIANYSKKEIEKLKSTKVDDSFGKTELSQFDMKRISDISIYMSIIEKAEIEARKKLDLIVPSKEVKKEVKNEEFNYNDIKLIESNMKKLFKAL